MPGLAVSLAKALEISRWEEEEPLKVELPEDAKAGDEDQEPLKVDLPAEADSGEEVASHGSGVEEPQKIAILKSPLLWEASAACLPDPLAPPAVELPLCSPMGLPLAEDCVVGCLGESPLTPELQLHFNAPLHDGHLIAMDGQDYLAIDLAEPQQMPLHMHVPDGQEPECCEAFRAWNAVYEMETATASPVTSSGSDYEYSPEGEVFFTGCFDHMRPWEAVPVLPEDSPCSLEDCMMSCLEESPIARAMQLSFQMQLPEALQPRDEDQAEVPSRGSLIHSTGQCKPCAWYYKSVGCQSGFDCDFCHLCPEGTLKAKKKNKQAMKRLNHAASTPQDNAQRFHLSLASLI